MNEFYKSVCVVAAVVAGLVLCCGAGEVMGAENPKSEQLSERDPALENAVAAGPHAVAHTEQAVAVVFTVRIIHNGEKALAEPQIRMRLPLASPHQDIDRLQIEGQPQHELDRWKELIAVYRQPELSPGQMLTGRWTTEGRIRALQWNLKDRPANGGPSLSAEEKALYLRDTSNFALHDPAITAAAREATAGRRDDVSKLEGIHDFVVRRLVYDRDGRWDPAPAVLASGKGSCSEYVYVFVALCRSVGIPARYAGGLTARPDKPLHVDLVNHRFAQAFVEGIGWVDFDPTRDKRSKTHRLYFGRTPGQMLLLCAGDGGPGTLTDWEYCSLVLWSGKGAVEDDDSATAPNYAPTAIVQVGWWLPAPSAEIRQQVAAFQKSLVATPPDQRRGLIAAALKIGHPFVLPWLDDLLYDPATRVEAARAFLKIGGKDALLAVVDNLCRQNDRTGDRQIGELLGAFTGEHFGPDRKRWKKWINTHTPPTPLPEENGGRKVAASG